MEGLGVNNVRKMWELYLFMSLVCAESPPLLSGDPTWNVVSSSGDPQDQGVEVLGRVQRRDREMV